MSKEGVKEGQSREQDMESRQEYMNGRNDPASIEKMSLSEMDMNVQKESSEKKNTKRIGIAGK